MTPELMAVDALRPAAFLVFSCAILALGYRVRLTASMTAAAPAYIEPTPSTLLNGGRIFDAVIHGDWRRDDNVSVQFVMLPFPGSRWKWESFHCRSARILLTNPSMSCMSGRVVSGYRGRQPSLARPLLGRRRHSY